MAKQLICIVLWPLLFWSCRDNVSFDDYVLAERGKTLNFSSRCSELERSDGAAWQEYALFEGGSENAVLSLGTVRVGWIYTPDAAIRGIALELEKMRMQDLSIWAGEKFALSLKIRNTRTGESIIGNQSGSFTQISLSSGGEHEQRDYQVSDAGDFEWVQFAEPEEGVSRDANKHPENIFIREDQIAHPGDTYVLFLVVESLESDKALELEGPALISPALLWEQTVRPEARQLGLLETLNPSQEGGLFDALRHGRRYDTCIELRKRVKREF